MFTFSKYHLAASIDEAYEMLLKNRNNAIVGGTAYLRMGNRNLATAIDLSALDLDYIREEEEHIEIGAMTTFRSIETSEILLNNFGGVVAKSVMDIVGIQLRSVVTVGATVFSKYGFSDFIPSLLALDTKVILAGAGEITLEEFLEKDLAKDILVAIKINKNARVGNYQTIRKTKSDYALLNVVSTLDKNSGDVKIVVGARPGKAVLAAKAMKYIKENGLTEATATEAGKIASEELSFGDNMRASAKYRQAICKVMVKRSLGEVM